MDYQATQTLWNQGVSNILMLIGLFIFGMIILSLLLKNRKFYRIVLILLFILPVTMIEIVNFIKH